jgi:NAD(P)-dependent dehydrogenase (short-subunit alcohol dehydrogenase family)
MFFFGSKTFSPATDIPDLSGKIILVTGGNNGLGKESILQLAKHRPAKIYMGARTESKAVAAIADIKKVVPDADIIFLDLDLSSFASVKDAANKFLAENDRLDILMNNAGIMAVPPGLTKEGYEIQFGTNHMGHALLTKLLLPILEKTSKEAGSDVRIVNLSSMGHTFAPSSGFEFEDAKTDMARYSTWTRYGQSKLANVLFTKGLAKRYPDIKSIAIHPGGVNTGLIDSFVANLGLFGWILKPITALILTGVEKGALGQLWAATAKDEGKGPTTGHFYYPVAVDFKGSDTVNDEDLADALWNWTEKEFESKGY